MFQKSHREALVSEQFQIPFLHAGFGAVNAISHQQRAAHFRVKGGAVPAVLCPAMRGASAFLQVQHFELVMTVRVFNLHPARF